MPLFTLPTLEPTVAQLTQQRQQQINIKVNALKSAPQQNFNGLLAQWQNAMKLVWLDPNPVDIVTGLGTNAVAIFTNSSECAAFLESLVSGCTTETMAMINKTIAANADGSITLS